MTSTADRNPHPEVSVLSDLTEDLLPAEQAAEIHEHIAGCAECAEVLASLAEIRGLLGSLPEPPPLPDDVATRIDAALAAEALLDSTRVDVPRGTSPAQTPPPSAPQSSDTPPSDTQSSAPVDVSRGTSTRPAGRTTAATGPGRSAGTSGSGATRDDSAPGRRSRRRRRALLTSAWAAAVLVVGGGIYGIVVANSNGSTHDRASQGRTSVSAASQDAVRDQVRRILAAAGPANRPNSQVPMTPDTGTTPLLTGPGTLPGSGPAQVPACVLQATGRTQTPLASQRETFQGVQSYLLVLPHPGDASQVDAFVVRASCPSGGTGTVLFQQTYPR